MLVARDCHIDKPFLDLGKKNQKIHKDKKFRISTRIVMSHGDALKRI